MFGKLFEERDRKISQLVKLGDSLGRSLRENILLFSIDGVENKVTYLTESNKIITGTYSLDKSLVLTDIVIQDSSILEDSEAYNELVDAQVKQLVEDINYNKYQKAEISFKSILESWTTRLKLSGIQQKLEERTQKLKSSQKIFESDEFSNLMEVRPQLVSFLTANLDKIQDISEIRNAVNLSNAVSKAFNMPRVSYEDLETTKIYEHNEQKEDSLYELMCRQELIKKELYESKKEFNLIWASNEKIKSLANKIFSPVDDVVTALAEAIKDVPYLALTSKKTLLETFNNCLEDSGIAKPKQIQEFTERIYQYKKPAKKMLINSLNEKYGINIQNLNTPPSFKSLANTQVVIFEALGRLCPKRSVIKKVLYEMANCMKSKSGVECIDLNEEILNLFVEAGLENVIQESGMKYASIDFQRVSQDIADIQDLIQLIKTKVSEPQMGAEDEEGMEGQEGEEDQFPEEEMGEEVPEEEQEEGPEGAEDMGDDETQGMEGEEMPEEGLEDEEGIEGEEMPEEDPTGEEGMEQEEVPEQEDVVGDLEDLESMINDIAAELNSGGEEEEEDSMPPRNRGLMGEDDV